MHVSPASTSAAQPLQRLAREAFEAGTSSSATSSPGSRSSDSVSLSGAASAQRYVDQLADLEPRADLVDRVQQQIQDGTYITDDKLNAAFEALLGDL